MIYLDNAATTLKKPDVVMQAVVEAMTSVGNAGRGASKVSLDASRIIYETRVAMAKLIGADSPNEIAFTSNATESLNLAIGGSFHKGDHVITTVLEHNSVLRPLYGMEKQGVELSFVGCDLEGTLQYQDMEQMIQHNTKAIICTHGSNLTGNCVDITTIGKLAKKYNLLFIVDGSQTVGVMDVNVKEMNIDILCFTGHKCLMGPQGTGGIYVRTGVSVQPLKVGGSGVNSYDKNHPIQMPEALEAGTQNSHGLAGLHAALGYINEVGLACIRKHEQSLMWRFYHGIQSIEGVKVYGDIIRDDGRSRPGIVSLNIRGYDSAEVSDELFVTYGIVTRPGAHCAPLMHQALGTKDQGAVRFSFAYGNTVEEVDCAICAIKELAIEA